MQASTPLIIQSRSADLVTPDYHISGLLKDALCGHQFANSEEVKDMMHVALCATEDVHFRCLQEAHGLK
jgi:hypothetical protein